LQLQPWEGEAAHAQPARTCFSKLKLHDESTRKKWTGSTEAPLHFRMKRETWTLHDWRLHQQVDIPSQKPPKSLLTVSSSHGSWMTMKSIYRFSDRIILDDVCFFHHYDVQHAYLGCKQARKKKRERFFHEKDSANDWTIAMLPDEYWSPHVWTIALHPAATGTV